LNLYVVLINIFAIYMTGITQRKLFI